MSALGGGHVNPARLAHGGSAPDDAGSVILEAIVTFVLLTIALGPLVGTLLTLVDRSTCVQSRLSSSLSREAAESPASVVDRWGWGPLSGVASWGAGPSLIVTLSGLGTEKVSRVGVWVDGWPVLELDATGQTMLVVGSSTQWLTGSGAELVIRARTTEGPWGPPLRTIVPGSSITASVPLENPSDAPASATVHYPVAGRLLLLLTGKQILDPAGPSAEPGLLPAISPGGAVVESTLASQSWVASPDRRVDLYL